jgi:hypothetical protein
VGKALGVEASVLLSGTSDVVSARGRPECRRGGLERRRRCVLVSTSGLFRRRGDVVFDPRGPDDSQGDEVGCTRRLVTRRNGSESSTRCFLSTPSDVDSTQSRFVSSERRLISSPSDFFSTQGDVESKPSAVHSLQGRGHDCSSTAASGRRRPVVLDPLSTPRSTSWRGAHGVPAASPASCAKYVTAPPGLVPSAVNGRESFTSILRRPTFVTSSHARRDLRSAKPSSRGTIPPQPL